MFWVYAIDWRTMAIELIAEGKSRREASAAITDYLEGLSASDRREFDAFKTIATAGVTPEMAAAVEQFKRVNGRDPGQ